MRALFLGVTLFCLLVLALPARADMLLTRALATASEDVQRSWTVQRTGLDYDGSGHLKARTVAQFDSSLPEGKRWTLISFNGAAPSKSERADFDDTFKANALPPTYALVKTIVTANAQKLSECATDAHYRIDVLPAGSTSMR
jgi:hypothetical protein